MSGIPTIGVPERGHVEIDAKLGSQIKASPGFWHLVDEKIISLSQESARRVRLSGSCYVGRVALQAATLDFREKVPGAVGSMLFFATHDTFRIERLPAPASDLGDLAALLIYHFLLAVKRYASAGREFRYRQVRQTGSLVGGRLDITRTVSIRARGLSHLIAFERSTLSHDTIKNRVIATALREVERLAKLIKLEPKQLASARALSLLFADCHDPEVLFAKRESFVKIATSLADRDTHEAGRDLLSLAAIILAHQSFENTYNTSGVVPRAWFLNLENLFQVAVLRVIRKISPGRVTTGSGAGITSKIFDRAGQGYRASPDIVVKSQREVGAVGDVKYKTWTGQPAAPDIYQLLVHTKAFKSNTCFLIYAHESFQVRELGISATGARTWAFAVDIRSLYKDLRQAFMTMGLPLRQESEQLPAA